MFRHIKVVMAAAAALFRGRRPVPPPTQSFEVNLHAGTPAQRATHNFKKYRTARQAAQLRAVMDIGKGYERVLVAAPEGYIWRQDAGALDGVGAKPPLWRLYKLPPKQYTHFI